jgi:hypothetical protein
MVHGRIFICLRTAMRLRLPLLVFALAVVPSGLAAQDDVDRRTPRQIADSIEVAGFARTLTGAARTDSARAAVLYEWVAQNVRYDAAQFFRGGKGYETAEDVFRHRIALCGGFVALYHRMAREIGLQTTPISGYAKGVDYVFGRSTRKSNHAWVALHLDGAWKLVDPTWGAGVINGRAFEPRFTWDFFLVSPDQLILSHFPEEDEWQLLQRPLPRTDFERMRAVPSSLFRVGFDPTAIRATALRPGVKDFPLAAPKGPHVRVVQAPIAGTLAAAEAVRVEIVWPGATEMALVTNGEWTKLTRAGDTFRGEVRAAGSSVSLVGRTGAAPYETLLHYRVDGAAAPRSATK